MTTGTKTFTRELADQMFIVTHANVLDEAGNPTEVLLSADITFGVYYSAGHKATVVVGSGGAAMPVKESLEEVRVKWQEALHGQGVTAETPDEGETDAGQQSAG